ncbi:MAG: sulfatase-like hydrolase/transferase [Xanthomonadales bacterium]|nr:sulfatase-like hydrolase/transferase [Xanthomonadales bacterium]
MSSTRKRNVLLITVDQMRYPRLRDGGGMAPDLKQVLSFQPLQADNSYAQYFPGFQRLRRNAVVMRQHMIGTSACVPSRALIYTGQYGTKTRVVETDSLYKYGSDPNFPWLNPKAIPTMGDWFRAAGYSTHYFGKWDLSYVDGPGPGHGDLNPWGFADWKMSAPDAQGGQLNQLGVYRDSGYVDMVETFLRRKAMNYESASPTPQPWLCVTSLVNPHDIASAYPLSWWMPDSLGKVPCVQTATSDTPSVRPIPSQGDRSNPLPGGRLRVPLNPRGFPQDCFSLPDTYAEDLATKPSCQFDYSYKMGLALKSRRPPDQREYWTLPFQLQDQADAWSLAFGQFYAYCHTLADTQIQRVLHALDETGLADDTLVVFLSDHGEYGVAHGGMVEKWHTAYDEILHVPFLVSAPWLNASAEQIRYVDQLTSHIDVLPTLLGLSGIEVDTLAPPAPPGQSWEPIAGQTYEPLPGADLTAVIENPSKPVVSPDGSLREGVLFISDDTITEYLKASRPHRRSRSIVPRWISCANRACHCSLDRSPSPATSAAPEPTTGNWRAISTHSIAPPINGSSTTCRPTPPSRTTWCTGMRPASRSFVPIACRIQVHRKSHNCSRSSIACSSSWQPWKSSIWAIPIRSWKPLRCPNWLDAPRAGWLKCPRSGHVLPRGLVRIGIRTSSDCGQGNDDDSRWSGPAW